MANSSTKNYIYICHFCSKEFFNRDILFAHFQQCQIKNSTTPVTKSSHQQYSLTQTELDILHMVKLHPLTKSKPTNSYTINNINLGIPLTNLYNQGYLSSSYSDLETILPINRNESTINLTDQLPSYHIYKFSISQYRLCYSRLKHNNHIKKSQSNESLLSISSNVKRQFYINIPTKIYSNQRLHSHSNQQYPLLFTINFHTLVQLPKHNLLNKYFFDMKYLYNLLNSLASQEFQTIVYNSEYDHEYSYTYINHLQETLLNYTRNTLKRNYLHEHETNHDSLIIPPLKIRRHDDSSYEIEKRSTSSSSSGMSITHINHNGHDDYRRYSETRTKKSSSTISDIQLNSNSNDNHDITVGFPSPKYQSVVLNEGARLRIVNCSNDSNHKRQSIKNSDENYLTKSTRLNTRKFSSTNSKTSDILELQPTYQAQSVLLSHNEIEKFWLTNNVFYRCHACSHEEFFVVLSRECMRLHISSKHGNMEENFKQRISNFLNNQGRALKIFQHYLKWQQPWSEKEIDQIFQLANINYRTNGAS